MEEEIRTDSTEVLAQEADPEDKEELTPEEISELIEEVAMLRWSSKPTTSSGRCC